MAKDLSRVARRLEGDGAALRRRDPHAQQQRRDQQTLPWRRRGGLLPAIARTEGNYRIYGDAHAERLFFILHCRSLDMTLDEIRVLLRFKDNPAQNCGEVNALLDVTTSPRQ